MKYEKKLRKTDSELAENQVLKNGLKQNYKPLNLNYYAELVRKHY